MKLSEKLVERLRTDLHMNIPKSIRAVRVRSGYWQLAAGAWRWTLEGNPSIGSCDTMRDCVECETLTAYRDDHTGDTHVNCEQHSH